MKINNKPLRCVLYPHLAIMLILIPISAVLMAVSIALWGSESVGAIIAYVISAYTLTVWCLRIPDLITGFRAFKAENKYIQRWLSDAGLRIKVSLYLSLVFNVIYAAMHLWLGIYHGTFWFYSLSGYYFLLAVMRYFLVRYTVSHKAGEDLRGELRRYLASGCILLALNLFLAVIVFFMVYWNRTFVHHMITTIALAAYTFFSLTMAIINIIKYRKYNSPLYSASKSISLAAACVSIITLESTMLTSFGDGSLTPQNVKLMLGLTGGAIVGFILLMAVYMIKTALEKLKMIKESNYEQ